MSSPEEPQLFEEDLPYGMAMAAIDALDKATGRFAGACAAYAHTPSDVRLARLYAAVEEHTQAFRNTTIALNNDITATELRKILTTLLLEQDAVRVGIMNYAIGEDEMGRIDYDPAKDKIRYSGLDDYNWLVMLGIQEDFAASHEQCLYEDTECFVEGLQEAA